MRDHYIRRLGKVRWHRATGTWSMVGPDNRVTTVSNSKLRMKLTRWIKASPGPTVLHTDAKREARAILRFIKETQVAGHED